MDILKNGITELNSELEKAYRRIAELEKKNKQLQEKSFNTEEFLPEEINDKLSEGIALVAVDSALIKYTNSSFDKMFGYASGELVGMPVYVLNAPTENRPEETGAKITSTLNETGKWSGEIANIRKDGTVFWSYASVSEFVHSKFGKVWLGVHRDITGSKLAKQALIENEQRLQTLVENVPGVCYRCAFDEHWTMEYISKEIETLSGYPRDGFIKNRLRSYASIIHPDDTQAVHEGVMEGVNNRRAFTLEYRIVRSDGEVRWVFEKGQGVFGEQGELEWLDGVILDYTEQKKLEKALQDSEKNLRDAQAIAHMGYLDWDVVNNKIRWSDETYNIYGFPLDYEPTLESTVALVHPDDLERVQQKLNAAIKVKQDYDIDHRMVRPDGKVIHVHAEGELSFNENGDVIRMLGTVIDITPRIEARLVAQSADKKLREIIDSIYGFIGLYTLDGVLIDANRAPLEAAGISREEVIGKLFWETYWWNYDSEIQSRLKDALSRAARGEIVRYESEIRLKDNLKAVIDVTFGPLRDTDGKIVNIVGFAVDISERKVAEKALAENQRALLSLMGILPGMVYRCLNDKDWSVEFASEGCLDLTGYPPTDLMSKKVSFGRDILHPEDQDAVWGEVQKGLENRTTYRMTYRIVRADGQVRWVWEQGGGIFDERGELLALEGFVTDITQRKNAEEELEKHQTHLEELIDHRTKELKETIRQYVQAEEKIKLQQQEQQQIINNMADAVIAIDESGTIKTFSKSAEVMFGYSQDEAMGGDIRMIMPPDVAVKHNDYVANYVKTGVSKVMGVGRELTAMRKGGKLFPVRVSLAELPSGVDEKRSFIGSIHELTEEKLREEQLSRNQKMDALGKLTGGIAHDFNNILAVILGFSTLLRKMPKVNDKQEGYINEIHAAGERAKKLTSKLMAFSKDKATDLQSVNINTIISDMQNMLEKTLTVRIHLRLDLDDEVWPVLLDRAGLEDALLNMSINSMHAMPDGGEIIISTRNIKDVNVSNETLFPMKGAYVRLLFEDNGIGMDKEVQAKIFDPFFTTKGDEGTGLGMSQVYGFVKHAGGFINVDSSLNNGARISLYFPKGAGSVEGIGRNPLPETDAPVCNEKILVVDDEISITKLTKTILEDVGYSVLAAYNGEQALKILEKEQVDLMITDVIMPGMGGIKLSETVQSKYPNVKIQLVSGYTGENSLLKGNSKLIQKLIYKPIDDLGLIKRVREILDADK